MNDEMTRTVLQVLGAVLAIAAAACLGGLWAALLVAGLFAVAAGTAW